MKYFFKTSGPGKDISTDRGRNWYDRYIFYTITAWTVFIAFITLLSYHSHKEEHIELAKAEARAAIKKDIIYRHWSASLGGIYVPVTEKTQPNPYLSHLPERDLQTTTGLRLTLVNPAYMSRQVFAMAEKEIGLQSHITSLKPLRPENAPDLWEKSALEIFERGGAEASIIISGKDNQDYMRVMKPLYVEKGCLKCHYSQGYKVGDVRGGISVTIPMNLYWSLLNKETFFSLSGHLFLCLSGIGIILWGGNRLKSQASELEASGNFIETVFNSIDDAIVVIDTQDYRISKVNSAFLQKYDITDGNVIGKKCYEVSQREKKTCVFSDEKCPISKVMELCLSGCVKHINYISRRGTKHVEVSVYPLFDKNSAVSRIVHVTHDITGLKIIETEIRKQKETAESASIAKSEFLSHMSHEIRNSLHAIRGYSDLVRKISVSEEQNSYLEGLRMASDTLLEISNDILDLSKIEAGMLRLEKTFFNIEDAVTQVVGIFRLPAKNKNVKLACHIGEGVPQVLTGDPFRLKQVLINLVSNAIKFTEAGEVTIAVELSDGLWTEIEEANNGEDIAFSARHVEIKFSVRDTGIGIASEKHESIFDSFRQADSSTSRKYGGSGLGLSISKKLVQLMNGRIWVNSVEGAGSVFIFTVCFLLGDENGPVMNHCVTAAFQETGFVRPPAILLVEDGELNENPITTMLQKKDCPVTVVQNGKEAVLLLSEKSFDIVLLNMSMAVMDGLSAARLIRDAGPKLISKNIPIILMTAYDNTRLEKMLIDIGINDYLVKPVKVDELIRVMRKWLPVNTGVSESCTEAGSVNNNSALSMTGGRS